MLMSASGIYALTTQDTNGVLSTGLIDIKIRTYRLNSGGQEEEYINNTNVSAGDVVSFIPKVANLGAECYLRIKIEYINSSVDFTDYVSGFSTDFEKHGEYYYYKNIVNPNETVKIFDTIKIPDDVESMVSDGKAKIEITAEAMQTNNFEPEYTEPEPWQDITPTENVTNSYDISDGRSTIIIKYEDNTNTNIYVPSTLFKNINKLMPGDIAIETIDIVNDNMENAKYYLKLDTNDVNTKEAELLNKMNLEVTNSEGVVLYKGKLLSGDRFLLGEYNLNESDQLKFKISVPSELPNDYSNLNPELSLIFSGEYKGSNASSDAASSGGAPSAGTTSEKSIISLIKSPKTGDRIDIATSIFLLSSIGLIIVMVLDFRERKKEIL